MTPAARERRQIEMPLLIVSLSAWALLVFKADSGSPVASCCPAATMRGALNAASVHMMLAMNPIPSLALGWLIMLAAMMAPLLATPLRYVIDRSIVKRRVRSVALFVIGYLAVWMMAGVLILGLALIALSFNQRLFVPEIIVIIAAFIWQSSPWKQLCINRGHVHGSISAFGTVADIDTLRFGLAHGGWCVGSCWALMLLPETMGSWHLVTMAGATVWLIAEKIERPAQPQWRLRGIGKASRIIIAQLGSIFHRRNNERIVA
jgi:predicted metal-binding membrane protein